MRFRVAVTLRDGSKYLAEEEFLTPGDQVAFERRYGVVSSVLARIPETFDSEGSIRPDADPAGVRNEWVFFVIWRFLRRNTELECEFDDFVEALTGELEVTQLEEEEAPFSTPSPLPT